MAKASEAFRTISEVADDLGVPKHVLRFWEVKFPQIKPMKRGGGRRYYRPEDVDLLRGIQVLLHSEGFTIRGVQKILREQGMDQVKASGVRGTLIAGLAAPSDAATVKVPKKAAAKRKAAGRTTAARGDPANVLSHAINELEACRAMLQGA